MTLKDGDMVGGRWEVIGGPISVGCPPDCQDPRCTRGPTGPMGHHCPHCGEATSMYGHFQTGRWVDGKLHRFTDGEGAFSCQPGFDAIQVEERPAA